MGLKKLNYSCIIFTKVELQAKSGLFLSSKLVQRERNFLDCLSLLAVVFAVVVAVLVDVMVAVADVSDASFVDADVVLHTPQYTGHFTCSSKRAQKTFGYP